MIKLENLMFLATNQHKLDNYILEKYQLTAQATFQKRLLAFLIELGEFINEQREFKYWSKKPSSEKTVLLEEFIDGIHFLISLGNTLQVQYHKYHYQGLKPNKEVSLIDLYLNCFVVFPKLVKKPTEANYFKVLTSYFQIAEKLDFSEEEILATYITKNKTNFDRQDNNY
ncbi:dUTP diphosphatase [Spiroplasma chrysopicola]|uniref:dUTP diphosphatase n=1 Tax=Spiroplasma chrysopicola DF-1 TaxID=1276227 RepID=R4U308_9MOLU|nr:dUTP diphosphatase [Spiroplasma chrysopicola]AGM24873.1 dUTP diphosphatase [Spiroplasma chrysopicola DF-1]